MHATKIAIIGAGSVGTTLAYTLAQRNLPVEIIIVDINEQRCRGEILDLSDALTFCKTSSVKLGTPSDVKQADIVVIAAGARQEVGQSRLELVQTNKKIITDIMAQIAPLKNDTILIMVTNPVDILTFHALKLSGLDEKQVFGSGTILDSMRLREFIAEYLKISPRSIHAYILGEHGDSQFPAWSISSIGGTPILEYPNLNKKILNDCAQKAKNLVYEIIKCKGSTFFGVASSVASICETIIFNQKAIIPLSCLVNELNVCLSVPCVLAKDGIAQQLPLNLTQDEQQLLKKSADILKREL